MRIQGRSRRRRTELTIISTQRNTTVCIHEYCSRRRHRRDCCFSGHLDSRAFLYVYSQSRGAFQAETRKSPFNNSHTSVPADRGKWPKYFDRLVANDALPVAICCAKPIRPALNSPDATHPILFFNFMFSRLCHVAYQRFDFSTHFKLLFLFHEGV